MMVFSIQIVLAADVITLNTQQTIEGKVTKIKHCVVTLKADEGKYQIPADHIYSIEFENKQDKVYLKYMDGLKVDPGKCVNGRLDAVNYHGKKSGHIAMGFLFGPFAMLGTALSDPTPEKGQLTLDMSDHPDLLQDPDYVSCYTKKAKGRLIGAETIGFGIAVLMIALITPTYLASQ